MNIALVWDMEGWDCPLTVGGYLDGKRTGEGHFPLSCVSGRHGVWHDREGRLWVAAETPLTPHRRCHPDWDVTTTGCSGGIRLVIPKPAMGEIRPLADNHYSSAVVSVAEVCVKAK